MLTVTTELDAINTMLSNIGESPVNTVEDNGVVDAVLARQILTSTSIAVQTRGWHFNTELGYPLTPTFPEKEIQLPPNLLRVDSVGEHRSIDVVQRGNRLYDRRNHTYQFDHGFKATLVILLPFDDMPESARGYITIKAARTFQERIVGAEEQSSFNAKDEMRALLTLQNSDLKNADYNILSDNFTTANALDRRI
ncbi:phage tail protein [Endozoicomonas ascidiicola]|uniref:phage tail protein n=1 Tax=Endozoicomonas ascidiicola TaxID=1698521 RepID=UPI00082A0F42|nr:phage tail protein [Endozoicomonas ascidiicola]